METFRNLWPKRRKPERKTILKQPPVGAMKYLYCNLSIYKSVGKVK